MPPLLIRGGIFSTRIVAVSGVVYAYEYDGLERKSVHPYIRKWTDIKKYLILFEAQLAIHWIAVRTARFDVWYYEGNTVSRGPGIKDTAYK